MSPDTPVDAGSVPQRQFSSARRGLDPGEVRAYLQELAEVIDDLQQRAVLERRRADEAEERARQAEDPDEHRLVELLGKETARVLDTARDAAAEIREKAEAAASRLISEANEQAHQRQAAAEADLLVQRAELTAEVDELRREAGEELKRRRAEADEMVAEIRREAELAADGLRQDGEEAKERAVVDAEALRDAAREESRRLVAEARTMRERVLGDLSRRRQSAREQLERLNAARDRLLAAYEVVRRTVNEATAELNTAVPEAKAAGDSAMRRVHGEPALTLEEMESQVSMARITGLLPAIPESPELDDLLDPAGAEEVAEEPEAPSHPDSALDQQAPDELFPVYAEAPPVAEDEEPLAAAAATVPGHGDVDGDGGDPGGSAGPVDGEVLAVVGEHVSLSEPGEEEADDGEADDGDGVAMVAEAGQIEEADGQDGEAARDDDAMSEDGAVGSDAEPEGVGPDASTGPPDDEVVAVGGDPGSERGHADRPELFVDASLPEARVELEAAERPDEIEAEHRDEDGASAPGHIAELFARIKGDEVATTPPDDVLLRQRDETLEPLERALARRLKRVLADEQNEVLDRVRRGKGQTSDELLPEAVTHAGRYGDAAADELQTAAYWGAASVEGELAGSYDVLAHELGTTMTEPLRDRIGRSVTESEGDPDELTERLRALYREWKNQRIGDLVSHYVAAAYALGAYDAVPEGAHLRWVVDTSGSPCPDAEDNALASSTCKGESFPTGHCVPPAHPGCRCLIVPLSPVEVKAAAPVRAS